MPALLPLPIAPDTLLARVVRPALNQLPAYMRDVRAEVGLVAISLQESNLEHRWQVIDPARPLVKGPARGLWQFERGTRASRGGVWGVFLHPASRPHLERVCAHYRVDFAPASIYAAVEVDDEFACCVARLLIFTDALPLPATDDRAGWWKLYRERCWRPGKPHPAKWPRNFELARGAVLGGAPAKPDFTNVISGANTVPGERS
jgi:hypothetical protein